MSGTGQRLRATLLASVFAAGAAAPAFAADTTIGDDTVRGTFVNIGGEDVLIVNAGAALRVTGQTRAVNFNSPTSGAGPRIDNYGIIEALDAGARAIDTSNRHDSRTVTLNNFEGATIRSDQDAFRIYNAGNNVTLPTLITVNNAGTIQSTVGEAIDLDSVRASELALTNAATGVLSGANGVLMGSGTIDNYGTIEGVTNAIRSNSTATTGFRDITLHAGSTTSTDAGAGGDAIYLSAGTNDIRVETGATIVGNIRGSTTASGGTDILHLFGTDTGLVPSISNFEGLEVLSGDWTATATLFVSAQGGTIAPGAIFRYGDGGTLGSISGPVVNNGLLVFNRSNVYVQPVAAPLSGTGDLQLVGTGTYAFTVTNSYSGATLIDQGTLRADAANVFSIASAVTVTGGALDLNDFDQSIASLAGSGAVLLGSATLTVGGNDADTVFSGAIDGTGGLIKTGDGTMRVTGGNTFGGTTSVTGGTLLVDGALAGGATVAAGARLGGAGTITGVVGLADGARLAPGDIGAAGTLATGALTLSSGSQLDFDLGAPGVAGASDRIVVTGDLTLDGTLNVNDVGGFGLGVYRLIDYSGTLTDNGLEIGTTPAGTNLSQVLIQTSVGQQINLVYGDPGGIVPTVQFWDGPNTTPDAAIAGGSGSWVNGVANWTRANGELNDDWGGNFAVFQGAAGTVTVDDAIQFGGIQFMTDGYEIAAGTGTLSAIETITALRVDPGVTATISAAIDGPGGLTKLDSGTLILTGANSYLGQTIVNGGTLRLAGGSAVPGTSAVTVAAGAVLDIAADQTVGSLAGAGTVALTGGSLTAGGNGADTSFGGVLTGIGGFTKAGGGTLILTGLNDNGGGTTVAGGTLRLETGATLGAGALDVQAGATLDLAGNPVAVGGLSGAGTIVIGTDGQIEVDQAVDGTFAGNMSGARGAFVKDGAGTLVLSGTNIFTGGTTINEGTLQLTSSTSLGNSGTVRINAGGTLVLGSDKTTGALSGGGALDLGSFTYTTNVSQAATFSGVASGSGGLTKSGAGVLTLSGTNIYTGDTTVNAGSLIVTGALTGDAVANAGATLGGSGTIAGDVRIADGGRLAPGAGGVGVLSVGSLTLAAGAQLDFELGAPDVPGASDRIQVAGDLTLDGTLNVADAGGFGIGVYRLIDYGGGLTDNGVTFGTLPDGVSAAQLELQTAVANQVNLIVGAALPDIQFWDGGGAADDGLIQGGTGSWTEDAERWSDGNGQANAQWGGRFAVFQGAAGTVTVDGAIDYTGMQFMTDGYEIAAGSGTLSSTDPAGNIRVDPGVTATISAAIGGAGGLTKLDSGILVLTGTNSYGGATNVEGGTLRLAGSSAVPATSAVTVSAPATLDIAAGQVIGSLAGTGTVLLSGGDLAVGGLGTSTEFAGALSGGGSLTKTGAGVLTLSGTIGHAGGTIVDAGTLRMGAGGALGTGGLTVNADGTFDLAGNEVEVAAIAGSGAVTLGAGGALGVTGDGDSAFGGVISGAGTLVKDGSGTLTLSGGNNISGGTEIRGGTLALATAGALGGGGTVTIGADGTLDIGGTASATFANAIAGDGTLIKSGSNTLTFTGASTFTGLTTISAGILRAGAAGTFGPGAYTIESGARLDLAGFAQTLGSISGAGALTLGAGTLTVGADNGSSSFDGLISGSGGSLVKIGTGTLTLTANNSYSGETRVEAGTLLVNGTQANSAVIVGALGRFGGNGSVAGLTVGGRLAPGNSIGVLRVAGNATFLAGSTFEVETVAGPNADLLEVTGTLTIEGGQVLVRPLGTGYGADRSYTIATATGGVTGTFDGVTSELAFLTPTLSYTADSVALRLVRNNVDFGAVAQTDNQRAVAAALQAPGSGALYDAVVSQSDAGARDAFDALSGEAHASLGPLVLNDGRIAREAVLGRLASAPADGHGVWAQFALARTENEARHGLAGAASRSIGLVGGIDARLGPVRIGAVLGYTDNDVSVDDRLSSADVRSTHVGLYAASEIGALRLRAGAIYSHHSIGTQREISLIGLADSLSGDAGGDSIQGFGEAAYRLQAGGITVEPFLGLGWIRTSLDGFTEDGGPAALAVSRQRIDSPFGELGLRAEGRLRMDVRGDLRLFGSFAVRHYTDAGPESRDLAFADTGESFRIVGTGISATSFVPQLGVSFEAHGGRIYAAYSGQFASGTQDHGVRVGLGWNF